VTDDGKPFLFLKRAPPSSITDPKKGEVSFQKGIILSAFGPGLFALQNEVVLEHGQRRTCGANSLETPGNKTSLCAT